jgi:hypothetical protein
MALPLPFDAAAMGGERRDNMRRMSIEVLKVLIFFKVVPFE